MMRSGFGAGLLWNLVFSLSACVLLSLVADGAAGVIGLKRMLYAPLLLLAALAGHLGVIAVRGRMARGRDAGFAVRMLGGSGALLALLLVGAAALALNETARLPGPPGS